MAKILVGYYSPGGNTKAMADLVAEGAAAAGADVDQLSVSMITVDALLDYDAIVIGSPTYYGQAATPIRKLFDASVAMHGKLNGKVGGAFASSANIGGGNETTILSILHSMLIHGMIIEGSSVGDHYGPVSVGPPDARVQKQCLALGDRIAKLAIKLFN